MGFFSVAPCVVAAIDDGRWVPGIGDPTPMGWATVGAYLAAASLCLLWARPSGAGRGLPLSIAALMALLAINKQLDLQSLFTELARDLLKARGWYERRRELQLIFIASISIGSVASLILLVWVLRRRVREAGLALLGLAFLSGFVLVRAASFHTVDHGLGESLGGLKLNWLLELGGIGMVLAGSIFGWLSRRSKPVRVESDIPARRSQAEPVSPRPISVAGASPGRMPSKPIAGFVVNPIRISSGPRRQSQGPDRPMAAATASPSGSPS